MRIAAALLLTAACATGGRDVYEAPVTGASELNARPQTDEVVYFLLPDRFENADPSNDRGGYEGDRLVTGFDPTDKAFYQGGDLRGLTERLDYIEGLGATAIWLGPIYENKPVQGGPGQESAGYHGYWITDFTDVDPHFGTKAELRAFVDAAHARGMKVFLDIITNHTADVISYRECHDPDWTGERAPGCPYRSVADYPYVTRGDAGAPPLNEGFEGDQVMTAENFDRLTSPDWAYTPYLPAGSEDAKTPAWLNDPIYYHNRGETTFENENSIYGDFFGLDDVFTEHPRVVEGMIEVFEGWITDYRIDGFRIDTARHVNSEFWQQFLPAVIEHARGEGIENFYVFGESFIPDAGGLARFTRVDEFPTVLDFAFQDAARRVIAGGEPTQVLEDLFKADVLYEGGEETARRLPTFLGNHDMGRFARFVQEDRPAADEAEVLRRTMLGHALLFTARGVPVIYSGDEQGFVGGGGDQAARQPLFPSLTASYNEQPLIGTDATTAEANFDTDHPLYRFIAEMAAIRAAEPALREGRQVQRLGEADGGLYAFSRIAPGETGEVLMVLNAGEEARTAQVRVDHRSRTFETLKGDCAPAVTAQSSYPVRLAPGEFVLCKAAW
jgi:glycosidase